MNKRLSAVMTVGKGSPLLTTEEKRRRLRRRIQARQRRKWQQLVRTFIFVVSALSLIIIALFVHGRKLKSQNAELRDKLSVSIKQFQKTSDRLETEKSKRVQAQADKKELQEENKTLSAQVDMQQQNKAYLTFDDGPSEQTEKILEILKKYNVKATFFVTGTKNPSLVPLYKKIVDEGHTLGIHTYSHDYKKIYGSLSAYEKDIQKISDYVYEQTGTRPVYYRFPGGSSNHVMHNFTAKDCIRYLNSKGITYFDWNVENGDATGRNLSTSKLISNVMDQLGGKKTAVILMHDANNKNNTVRALPAVIKKLQEKKYNILPINEYTPLVQHVAYDSVK